MAERSKELIEVGYYLSRFGISNPPSRFGDIKWNEVYRMFYDRLGQGRKVFTRHHHPVQKATKQAYTKRP